MNRFVISLLLAGSMVFAQTQVSGDITVNTTWGPTDNILLVGQTFVKSGVTLTIEPGTTIKANPDDGTGLAPALVVERGAIIIADGSASSPITFTSNLPADQLPARGTWGGLIVLGGAPISTTGGENFVEGLAGIPYGGSNADDSSGVLRYVRVWYGGRSIGQDNEINGITLAGVGRKTVVEHCEVAWNLDDGFEMFGGTVDLKYCSVLFVGDDAFDVDEGYQGRGQFLFAMVGEDEGNRAYEMDNKTNSDFNSQPRSYPQFFNVTLIGSGDTSVVADNDQVIRLREGVGGVFKNTLVYDGKAYGIKITDDATLALLGDSLLFSSNNIVYGNKAGAFAGDYGITVRESDPLLTSIIGRETGGLIDPRPGSGSPAISAFDTLTADDFFAVANYVGAFEPTADLWIEGWSWLSMEGRTPKATVAIADNHVTHLPDVFRLEGNYPNPFNPSTRIRYSVSISDEVQLNIYNLLGQLVYRYQPWYVASGQHEVLWEGADMNGVKVPSGIYIYEFRMANQSAMGKMTLLK